MIYWKLGIILFIIAITAAIIGMKNKRANEFFYPREKKVAVPTAAPQEGGKEIMVTNGVKHSIPLEEIQSGGVGKDGIPAINHPQFVSMKEAEQWLADDEPGVTFSRGGTHRFYPYYILLFHEIVNDIVPAESGEPQRVLVTYCPLCLTGIVFDPVVGGERVEFGISGKLWKSNLVMYDRKTESLWPQVLGEAVAGEMTGAVLAILPSDQVRFGNWKKQFPQGEVLSRETSRERFFGSNPYGDYFSVPDLSLFLAKPTDTRLPHEALVLGLAFDGKAKAYHVEAVRKKGIVEDTFAGMNLVLRYNEALDAVRIFKKLLDGTEERINPFSAFWFSWAAAHPETELYK